MCATQIISYIIGSKFGLKPLNMSVKVGVLISFIALVSSVISTSIPYWVYGSEGSASAYEGLWKVCADSEELPSSVCCK